MNGLLEFDHSAVSYYAWHKSVDELVKDKRSTKPFTEFIKTSYELLYENTLYKSRATQWKSNTYEFEFIYDTVPAVKFKDLNLKCYSNKDSSIIYDTKGVYFPLNNRWVGKKGKVNWKRAGFDENQVFALLDDYEIVLRFSRFSADSVSFFNKNYWNKPLHGNFEEKVLANVTKEKASYPRFSSYFKQVEIQSVFEDIDFIGGVEMNGSKLYGQGDKANSAILTFYKDDKMF